MPDEATPAEGGNGEAQEGQGLYDLDSVPQEQRDLIRPHLDKIESNVNAKFREAADYRKQWEPYEQLGVNELEPQALESLLQFAQMAQDPQAFQNWWEQVGQEMGFSGDEGTDDFTFNDDNEGMVSPDQIKEMIAEALQENLNPVYESMAAQQQQQALSEAQDEIQQQMDQIKQQNPKLPEGAEETILQLAYAYAEDDPDPIAKGFADYQNLIAQGEKGLFDQKSRQPGPVEGAGGADTSAEKITSFEDAKAAATERLKQYQS